MFCKKTFDLIKFMSTSSVWRDPDLELSQDETFEIFLLNELYEYETKGADRALHCTMELARQIFNECGDAVDTVERLENCFSPWGVGWHMLDHEVTRERLEEIGSKTLGRNGETLYYQVNQYQDWFDIYEQGDKFYSFYSKDVNEWKNLAGQSGYCMVRGNKIIRVHTTMRT